MTNQPTFVLRNPAGVLWMSGADRLDFLERMSTNRLADLNPGSGRATAVLDDIGRVVDLVQCYAGAEGAVLTTSAPESGDVVATHLRRYVLFRDAVRITDAGAQVTVLRVFGPDAEGIAREATALQEGATDPGTWIEHGEDDETVWLLRQPEARAGGLGAWDIVVPAGAASDRMTGRLHELGVREPLHDEALLARVRAGQPAFGAEIDGGANPLELGLRPIVDFAKGCYIGQEVVARLDTYDKVQRRLVTVAADAPIAVGDVVTDDPATDRSDGLRAAIAARGRKRVGRITTVARDHSVPDDAALYMALALLPKAIADRNSALFAHSLAGGDQTSGAPGGSVALDTYAMDGRAIEPAGG